MTATETSARGTVIVTGGEGGIGVAICRYLYGAGYDVVSVDRHAGAAARGGWRFIRADVTSASDVRELHKAIDSLAGLVNCAGVLRAVSVVDWPDDTARMLFEINFFAAARLVSAFANRLVAGSGIVNVSSISWRLTDQGALAAYGASKAALESYTRQCATQLGSRGIRVNAIAPGIIDVAMSDDMRRVAVAEGSPLRRCALGRMGTAAEVAECVEFLLRATYVNGTTLVVDGGLAG